MTEKKWVSVWGNAVSVAENRPERYAKDITIRYPIHIPFAGEAVRLTFDNYCGTEPITLSKVTVLYGGKAYPVLFGNERAVTIGAGENAVSDPLAIHLIEDEVIQVSFYLADFTLMRSVVYTCGPLPMLKALYKATGEVSGEYSLEERMGCGFGACMGCSIMTKEGAKRVCKDGPIFQKEVLEWQI